MTPLHYEYWPSLNWMYHFCNSDKVILQHHGNYQKQSLFNRCHIIGRNGPLTLSVPLAGGREQRAGIADISIDPSQRWAIKQLRTIRSCYGKAPFFEYYFPVIESLLTAPYQKMLELNQAVLQQLIRWLQWKGVIQETSDFEPFSLPAQVDFSGKTYVQVFAGSVSFFPDLSVLDALMCLGPQLKHYLA